MKEKLGLNRVNIDDILPSYDIRIPILNNQYFVESIRGVSFFRGPIEIF